MVSNQHLLQTNSSINMHTTIEHLCLFCQFHMFFSSPYHPIILQVEEEETIEGTKLFLAINEVKHCDQPLKKKQLQTGKKTHITLSDGQKQGRGIRRQLQRHNQQGYTPFPRITRELQTPQG